jgi:hypothetical protein
MIFCKKKAFVKIGSISLENLENFVGYLREIWLRNKVNMFNHG